MKILYITPDITDSGGIARVIALKTNYLIENYNYEICIVTVKESKSIFFYEFNDKIHWITITKNCNFFKFFREYFIVLKESISNNKPDVIVICDAVLWLFIPWFIRTSVPVVFETHFSVTYQKLIYKSVFDKVRTPLVRALKQATINKFTCSVFLTHEGSREWNLKRYAVIPNPLSFGVGKTASLNNKKAIGVCLNPYVKGLDRLLLVWSEVVNENSDWMLDIYGQWDDENSYIKMAEELNIFNNVNFIETTKNINDSFKQSSLFLMTSRSEAFGMALLEALASGLPCVAFDCPVGPRVMVENAINGYLIEDGNVDEFVSKVKLLIDNESLRVQMGMAAQKSVLKYEINNVMQQWKLLLENLVTA